MGTEAARRATCKKGIGPGGGRDRRHHRRPAVRHADREGRPAIVALSSGTAHVGLARLEPGTYRAGSTTSRLPAARSTPGRGAYSSSNPENGPSAPSSNSGGTDSTSTDILSNPVAQEPRINHEHVQLPHRPNFAHAGRVAAGLAGGCEPSRRDVQRVDRARSLTSTTGSATPTHARSGRA